MYRKPWERDNPGASPLSGATSLYESLGVRPLINCRGSYTIIGGSLTLPEVKQAMDEASRRYVDLDELMEAVGCRLAQITQADSAIVTCGCAAAISLAVAACIFGTDTEMGRRLPGFTGPKNKVLIPRHSRNPYETALRLMGVALVEVETLSQLVAACDDQTAMVYLLSSPEEACCELNVAAVCRIAKAKGIPVFVDAAAEKLVVPNVHLSSGADLVGYSGGKCLRGPQASGLLLGRRDLVQAAWLHGAPHQNIGRSMKVGKEEVMGLLAAVEMWIRRDHDAEWKRWQSWLAHIRDTIQEVPSVYTKELLPVSLSNYAPRLQVMWSAQSLRLNAGELYSALDSGEPRIQIADPSDNGAESIIIMPYMMEGEEYKVVAESLRAMLSSRISG